jgi:hypothetical protein
MDSSGNFFLGGASGVLQWNGTALTISATSGGNSTVISSGATAFAAGPTGAPITTITQAGVLTSSSVLINDPVGGVYASVIRGWDRIDVGPVKLTGGGIGNGIHVWTEHAIAGGRTASVITLVGESSYADERTIVIPSVNGTMITSSNLPSPATLGAAATIHNLIDTTNHPVSGLTSGHFLKATGTTSYGFAAHGLAFSDLGSIPTTLSGYGITDAATSTHNHTSTYPNIETSSSDPGGSPGKNGDIFCNTSSGGVWIASNGWRKLN